MSAGPPCSGAPAAAGAALPRRQVGASALVGREEGTPLKKCAGRCSSDGAAPQAAGGDSCGAAGAPPAGSGADVGWGGSPSFALPALRVRTHRRSGRGCGSTADEQPDGAAAAAGLAALAAHPAFAAALQRLEADTDDVKQRWGGAASSLAAAAALLSATSAVLQRRQGCEEAAVAEAREVAGAALRWAARCTSPPGASEPGTPWRPQPLVKRADGRFPAAAGGCSFGDGVPEAAEAPMQALLDLLEGEPWRLQAAFLGRAAPDPASPSYAAQPRHSLVALAGLPAVLAEAMPAWPRHTVEYAAQQICWHINVVAYSSDSPLARDRGPGGGGGSDSGGSGGSGAGAGALRNMLYAEMAAAIIAAADTEAGAAGPACAAAPIEQALVANVAEALLGRGDAGKGLAGLLQIRVNDAAAGGRSLALTDAAAMMVDVAGGPVAGDGRAKAWLAAALLTLVGGALGGAAAVAALSAGVAHLQRLAVAAREEQQRQLRELAAAGGGAAGCSPPAQRASEASSSGGAGGALAALGALGCGAGARRTRRFRTSHSPSRCGSEGGVGFGGLAPWQGAVSGQASVDADLCLPAAAEDGVLAAAVDVLRL